MCDELSHFLLGNIQTHKKWSEGLRFCTLKEDKPRKERIKSCQYEIYFIIFKFSFYLSLTELLIAIVLYFSVKILINSKISSPEGPSPEGN